MASNRINKLPSTYQAVEYLITTGHNARIDTGVAGNNTALKIFADMQYIEFKQYQYFFGNSGSSATSKLWRVIVPSVVTANWLVIGNYRHNNQGPAVPSGLYAKPFRIKLWLEYGYSESTINGVTYTTAGATADDGYTETADHIAIGSAGVDKTGSGVHFWIYSFKMWNGETPIRDYVPCYRKSDNVAGFYDIINETFSPSIGSVAFGIGPEIKQQAAEATGNPVRFITTLERPLLECKAHFEPVQSGSGDPSPSNVRQVSGWTGLTLNHDGGRNLYDKNADTDGYYIQSDGTLEASPMAGTLNKYYWRVSDYLPVTPNGSITYHGITARGTAPHWAWYDVDKTLLSTFHISTLGTETLSVPALARYLRMSVYGYGDDHKYCQVYNDIETIPVTWNTEAGTIYGGYVDFIAGEVVATYGIIPDLGELTWYWIGEGYRFRSDDIPNMKPTSRQTKLYCSALKPICNGEAFDANWDLVIYSIASTYSTGRFYIHYHAYNNDVTGFTNAISGYSCVFELETPVHYQLTGWNVKALCGINNFWSNAGKIGLQYVFDDSPKMLRMRRRILQSGNMLPAAYKRVAYLDTIGTSSRLNTGVAGNDNTIKIDFIVEPLARGGYASIMGNHDTEDKTCWRLIQGSTAYTNRYNFTLNNRRAGSSPSCAITELDTIVNKIVQVHMEHTAGWMVHNDTKYYPTTVAGDTSVASSLAICFGQTGPTKSLNANAPSHRFHKFIQIHKQGKLVRNYIPCYRKSDNKPGFYDTVNGTFNVSDGTNDFVLPAGTLN